MAKKKPRQKIVRVTTRHGATVHRVMRATPNGFKTGVFIGISDPVNNRGGVIEIDQHEALLVSEMLLSAILEIQNQEE
jgi:hypothetical protein